MHVEYSEFLADHGIAVLIFDYRGYGRSSPASGLTRNALMEDARAAMAYLKARPEVDPERIGVMGVSLGGVFASRLAVKDASVKALCTVAAFSSWRGIAGDHLPVIGPLILPGGLDPADSVRSARKGLPMLLVHGDRDEIVPVRHAGVLEAAAREAGLDVTTLIVEGASHNSVMFTNQGEQQAVGDFFARALGVPGVEGSPRR